MKLGSFIIYVRIIEILIYTSVNDSYLKIGISGNYIFKWIPFYAYNWKTFFPNLGLQAEIVKTSQENQNEQKLLRETIDKLQTQLIDKEQELAGREHEIRRQKDKNEDDIRKFELEKEITLQRFREEKLKIQVNLDLTLPIFGLDCGKKVFNLFLPDLEMMLILHRYKL